MQLLQYPGISGPSERQPKQILFSRRYPLQSAQFIPQGAIIARLIRTGLFISALIILDFLFMPSLEYVSLFAESGKQT
jgi:hypothetical protein